MPGPIPIGHCEYDVSPDDPTNRTVRFTTTGIDGLHTTWRWGDCTDSLETGTVIDHAYSGDGTYEAIGHVQQTGQRMVMTVGVLGVPEGRKK